MAGRFGRKPCQVAERLFEVGRALVFVDTPARSILNSDQHGRELVGFKLFYMPLMVAGGGAPTLGRWFYGEASPPVAVLRAEGEDDAAWAARTAGLGDDLGPGLDAKVWKERLHASDGRDLIPPPGWMRPWPHGEYQISARYDLPAGGSCLWVLIPYRRGGVVPQVEAVGTHGVRVVAGGVSEEVHLGSEAPNGQAVLVRDGVATVLLKADTVPRRLDGGADGPGFTLPSRPDCSGAEPNR